MAPLALAPDTSLNQASQDIARQQQAVVETLSAVLPGCVVERSFSTLYDGLVLRLPEDGPDDVRAIIAGLPGVSAVYDDVPYSPTMFASVPLMGVPEAWAAVGGSDVAGEGVKIAVIDSGIDIDHPMLSSEGLSYPTGYPLGDSRYCTPKVIASRLYVRPTDPPAGGENSPVPGALGSGHGTYLAAVVAGSEITATYRGVGAAIAGVAPRAQVMNYRVFYPGTTESGIAYTAELVAAIEDAVADGADVILTGWSSSSAILPGVSPVAEALEAAVEAGSVVVAPAGNDGPESGSVSRIPGGIESVITVGASTKDASIDDQFVDVLSPAPVLDGLRGISYASALFGPAVSEPIGPAEFVAVADVDPEGSDLACDVLPAGSLTNRVALIARGECSFATKAYHAQEAGALAAIIINDEDTITEMACVGDYCQPGMITIPSVMVSSTDGAALGAWVTLWPTATLSIDPTGRLVSGEPDLVADYSGRGPAYASTLKPDLVAPGSAVLSATWDGSESTYTQLSGTSVAAAQVAGCTALLLQAHPDWQPQDVKRALMGTGDIPASTTPLSRGAGRVNVGRAVSANIAASPPSVSLAHSTPGQTYERSVLLRDLRETGDAVEWSIQTPDLGSASVGAPASVTTMPGETVTMTLEIGILAEAGAGDVAGDIVLSQGTNTCVVPAWAHIDPLSMSADILVIDNDFSQFGAFTDYAGYVTDALNEAGYTVETWDADANYGQGQTLPDVEILLEYPVIIWLTGDNVHADGYFALSTPLTAIDQSILARYLDSGGRLLAIGQNLAEASDVNADPDPTWGRSALYHGYLSAHWLQSSLYDPEGEDLQPPSEDVAVVGHPGTFLAGVQIDLGPTGDGAGNQTSVDEVAPGGTPDLQDAHLVTPILATLAGMPVGAGYVGLAKACEPTLEADAPCDYRTVYLSFGLEGMNENRGRTTRPELLDIILRWLLDEVTVTSSDAVWAPNEPFALSCEASSSQGAAISSYRWRADVGTAVSSTVTEDASLTVNVGQKGSYTFAVQATDSLGHSAVTSGTMRMFYGGNSTLTASATEATPGRDIVYEIDAANTGPDALDVTVRLPVPNGTQYVSHEGGTYEDGTLAFEVTLAPASRQTASLRVVVAPSAQDRIVGEAEFVVGDTTFSRSVVTWIGTRVRLPLVFDTVTW